MPNLARHCAGYTHRRNNYSEEKYRHGDDRRLLERLVDVLDMPVLFSPINSGIRVKTQGDRVINHPRTAKMDGNWRGRHSPSKGKVLSVPSFFAALVQNEAIPVPADQPYPTRSS